MGMGELTLSSQSVLRWQWVRGKCSPSLTYYQSRELAPRVTSVGEPALTSPAAALEKVVSASGLANILELTLLSGMYVNQP